LADCTVKKQQLIITTRESPLALRQTEWVKTKLTELHPELQVELLGVTTRADKLLTISLSEVGGKGLFVKELEEALLEGRAQLAVHSMKDMPMEFPLGLGVPVVCEREEVRDVLVSNHYASLETLPTGARIGTSSLRRQSQLRALRPDLIIENLRGNVNTRLARLDRGDYDALILAGAGLKRLGLEHRIATFISIDQILPAVGQGALALECHEADGWTKEQIAPLNHAGTFACVTAERALCRQLGGGCQLPVAAYAELVEGQLDLRGLVGSLDGKIILQARLQAALHEAESLGKQVADLLLQQGADKILREFH
jgi:hydroxymethylbilane synthase